MPSLQSLTLAFSIAISCVAKPLYDPTSKSVGAIKPAPSLKASVISGWTPLSEPPLGSFAGVTAFTSITLTDESVVIATTPSVSVPSNVGFETTVIDGATSLLTSSVVPTIASTPPSFSTIDPTTTPTPPPSFTTIDPTPTNIIGLASSLTAIDPTAAASAINSIGSELGTFVTPLELVTASVFGVAGSIWTSHIPTELKSAGVEATTSVAGNLPTAVVS